MLFIKFIVLFIYIFSTSFFIGKFVSKILKRDNDFIENIVYGFIFNIAAIQFLLWPMIAFRQSKNIFFIVSIIITSVFTILGLYISLKKIDIKKIKDKINDKKKIKEENKYTNIIKIIFMVLVLVEIISTSMYYRSDADDSFYVSNSTLFFNSDTLNEYDSSFGDSQLGTVPMYDFQVWESVISVYSHIINVEPVVVSHLFLIPILIIMSNFASYVLGKSLLKSKNKAYFFACFIIIFSLFGGYSTYSFGSRILSRIWQGKSLYLSIVLPAVMAYILNSFDMFNYKVAIEMFACILAAVGFNPTSLFVIGFEILFLVIAIAIYKKSFKDIVYIIPSVIVVLIFTLLIFFRTSQYSGQISAASIITYSQIFDILKRFFAENSVVYLILYFLASIFLIKNGNKEQKVSLVIVPILMFFFIWNPISGKIVAENITKVSTFWRVYWLIPFMYGIAVAIIVILQKLEKRLYKALFIMGSCIIICISGKWLISSENGFVRATNIYRLPEDTIIFGEKISNSNNTTTIAKDGINTTLRQRYSNIKLIFSRYQYVLDLIYYRGNVDDAQDRIKLQELINGNEENINELSILLYKYDIHWIIIGKENNKIVEEICNSGYKIIENSMDNFLLEKI